MTNKASAIYWKYGLQCSCFGNDVVSELDLSDEEINLAVNEYKEFLDANKYKTDRLNGNYPTYKPITDAGDILQRLITALEGQNISIPQECLDYRNHCQLVKTQHPKGGQ